MWKRLNNRPTSPTTVQIGQPTLVETTLDEDSAAKLRDLYPVDINTNPDKARSGQAGSRSKNSEGSGSRHVVT